MAPALQITIPSTSIAKPKDSRPYTLYHIHLQLPLRLHQVQKRYTDFVKLQQDLISETGAAPPAPLPAKSWIRRTVDSEALTENRRRALETYVVRIVESDDARWRSSSAWRSFLNLPGGGGGGGDTSLNKAGGNGSVKKPSTVTGSPGAGGGLRDPNEWLELHRELRSQLQIARSRLKQRDAATTAQQQHAISADAKASLVRAAASITQLDDGLKSFAAASDPDAVGSRGAKRKLGDGEIRRRRDLIGAAKSEVEGLEAVLRSMPTHRANAASPSTSSSSPPSSYGPRSGAVANAGEREALWKGGTKTSARVLGGPPPKETERTRELDNTGVLQLQQQIFKEQDEDVMALGKTVARLKDMGILINEELEIQNEMLGLVDQDVDRLRGKIDVGRERIKRIN